MSKDVAIKVNNLSKSFILPHEKHVSVKSIFINFHKRRRGYEKQQVLNGISFEVKKGEFCGIVGQNGGGKSTLLKLLAGIYTPDTGEVTINGKLTPFIELGVGFNPDLSGRENVFLNGSLLGFSRKEMMEMYDEIVEFAELERFMDQKLKNYSSGMQVRLAFSIAIRVQSGILLLDEVLAVGDESFQRKCNQYFQSIKDTDKTVILVTHSMEAVRKFCTRAILISNGKIKIDGSPEEVANQYTEDNFKIRNPKDEQHLLGLSERVPKLKVVPVSKTVLYRDDKFVFDIEYEISDDKPITVAFSVVDLRRSGSVLEKRSEVIKKKGKNTLRYTYPLSLFNEGDFNVVAVIDEEGKPRQRVAFTSEINSCKFAIRNKERKNNGLLFDHGEWS